MQNRYNIWRRSKGLELPKTVSNEAIRSLIMRSALIYCGMYQTSFLWKSKVWKRFINWLGKFFQYQSLNWWWHRNSPVFLLYSKNINFKSITQFISKCPCGVFKSTKKSTKFSSGFSTLASRKSSNNQKTFKWISLFFWST